MPRWFDKILGIDKIKEKQTENFELITGGISTFSNFSGDAYENDVFRSAVDAIARHVAKLSGKHAVINATDENNLSKINRTLQDRPNPYMSGYDFLYKVATQYFLYNNAFVYVQKDHKGNLDSLYPLAPTNVEFIVDGANKVYIKFLFKDGEKVILHYDEVAILRRHFNNNELLGDDNTAILSAIELAHTQNEGMSEAIKNSAQIRGILKYNQALSPSKLKEAKDEFMSNYMTMANNGGIVPVDQSMEYHPLSVSDVQIDTGQIETVKAKIYDYLGISESIVNGTYDEDGWQAFFESVVEPFSIQIGLEFTEKIFSEREKAFGNRIIFESSRLQYASNQSKTNVIKELLPLGVLTINQALDLLNLPRVKDGDERLQSLNYIKKTLADNYQMADTEEVKPHERD